MTRSYGIDYGYGKTNLDKTTGIRFGVIPSNAIDPEAFSEFESEYGEPTCPKCGNEAEHYDGELHNEYDGDGSDYACNHCEYTFMSDEAFSEEPIGYVLEDGDLTATCGPDGDIFVHKSPYFTFAQYCSPCAPGACYLLTPVDKGGPKAFCLGHDFFDNHKAPYPIWRVADGTFVKPGDDK